MDDQSSNQSFPSHHHRHHPFLHISLPGPQSSKQEYVSPPAVDLLEYEGREKEFTSSFMTTGSSPDVRRMSGGCERALLSPKVDGGGVLREHLDHEVGLVDQVSDSWYSGVKKVGDVWENSRSFTSTGYDFYSNRIHYGAASDTFPANADGIRCKGKGASDIYSQCSFEAKDETAYENETWTSSTGLAGSISDGSLDYRRTDSRVSDSYLSREEDYGSSCGSGEDQFQPAEPETPWLQVSPSAQIGESRWKADAPTSECHQQQRSPACGTYPQKLDSFSDAFLRQRKKMFPVVSSSDCSGLGWDFGPRVAESPGSAKLRHNCAFDSDSYLPAISSSSPAHPSSLASFPSPPTPSHLMSSVLSPPPTPRPIPSYSPSKTDSPGIFRGAGHSVVQGGEAISALQFFTPHLQPLPPIHTSGMVWKLPLLTHGYPQSSANMSSIKSSLRAPQNAPRSKEPSFLATLLPSNSHGPSSSPSVNMSFHLPPVQSQHFEQVDKTTPYMLICRGQNGTSESQNMQLEHQPTKIYTGAPFPSILYSGRGKRRSHYTPPPLLNPVRRGSGLYSSVQLLPHNEVKAARAEEEDEGSVLPCVNVGPDFQAELPRCFVNEPQMGSRTEESCSEQLLWKPLDELKDSTSLQEKVDKLLFMCSSSCLPGGGSNTELALHCLHLCNGDTVATLEKLLFSQPLSTGDYHYSGSDFWTEGEKSLFSAVLEMHGKEFSLIHKMVRTKTVPQCVEYYYLSKKLHDKQEKEKEEERQESDLEQQARATPTYQTMNGPFALEEVVPAPLTSFFPCKLCGKIFYKIKSRNAHMKIHRQPQDDWTERRLQHQLLTHRLSSNALRCVNEPTPQSPASGLASPCLLGMTNNGGVTDTVLSSLTSSNNLTTNGVASPGCLIAFSNAAAPKGHTMANTDDGHSGQREPGSGLPFRQPWASLGQGPDPVALFCNHEGKDNAATVGLKEPINW